MTQMWGSGWMHICITGLLWIGRVMIKDIGIGRRTMRKHHSWGSRWTWMVIIINGWSVHWRRMMQTTHRLWLSGVWGWTKPYFDIVLRCRVRCIRQFGFLITGCRHSLSVTSWGRWIGWIKACLDESFSSLWCYHRLKFSSSKGVHMSCLGSN